MHQRGARNQRRAAPFYRGYALLRYRVASRGVELWVDVLNRSAADLLSSGQPVALDIAPEAIRELDG